MMIGERSPGDDLADSPRPAREGTSRIDTSRLTSPVVLVAIGAAVLGLTVLLWPIAGDPWPARVLGAATVLVAARSLRRTMTRRPFWSLAAGLDLSVLVVGILLVLTPARPWPVVWEVLDHLAVLVALAWIGMSALVVVTSLDAATPGVTTYAGAGRLVVRWLLARPSSATVRQDVYDKLLHEGSTATSRIGRFLTLMALASVIASLGVIADSTVAVIAAMLIAPLMIPMMGMAMSLVMGWPRRLARSATVAAAGIAVAFLAGLALALINTHAFDIATNSEISSRVMPTLRDLIIAVAAGAAGAYGLSRPDVSDALPGAAVAVSLVPPLTVAGATASQGDWSSTAGALLLFATSTLAVLIMGGMTFVLTGVAPIQRAAAGWQRAWRWLLVIGAISLIVTVALLLNGATLGAAAFEENRVETTVDHWLSTVSHHQIDTGIDEDTVTVVIVGPYEDRPDATELADDLAAELGRPIAVDVRFLVEDQVTAVGE